MKQLSVDTEIVCVVLKQHGNSFDLEPADPGLPKTVILGAISGKMRRKKIVPGDLVRVRVSEYSSKSNKPIGLIVGMSNASQAR